jgi:flagellar assembly protein FliH
MAPIIRKPMISGERRTLGTSAIDRAHSATTLLPKASQEAAISGNAAQAMPDRGAPFGSAPKPVAGPDLAQLRAEALKQAREELQATLAEQSRAAQAEGYAEGMRQAEAKLKQEAQQQAQLIQERLADLQQQCLAALADSETLAAQIAYEAICRLAGEALVGEAGVRAVVRNIALQLGQQPILRVKLSPLDLARLRLDEQSESVSPQIQWLADERIETGGCIVETAMGELDARLDVLLKRTADALRAAQGASAS